MALREDLLRRRFTHPRANAMSIVYVLTNPAMPSLVKIGCTENEDANTRIAALYSTGVPVPFTIESRPKLRIRIG